MFILQVAGQVLSVFIFEWVEPDYYSQYGGIDNGRQAYIDNGNDLVLNGVENNAIFVFVNNIYLVSVLAFNISRPWRKEFYFNAPLVVAAALALTYNVVMALVAGADWDIFDIIHLISFEVRLYLTLASLLFSILIYVCQKAILEPLSYKLIKRYPKKKWL
jgi:magnesium-transporting ATPase (P-type)